MRDSPLIAKHAHRIAEVAPTHADRRVEAGRRTSEYKMYARMFFVLARAAYPAIFQCC